jgi:hypothetical protein
MRIQVDVAVHELIVRGTVNGMAALARPGAALRYIKRSIAIHGDWTLSKCPGPLNYLLSGTTAEAGFATWLAAGGG